MMISKILLVCLAAFIVVQAAPKKGRIVGGQETKPGEYPYQVSIQQRVFIFFHIHACGGSIISPRWVLTAAHCVYGADVSSLLIKAGMHEVYDVGQSVNVKTVIIHPDYWGPDKLEPYDIALLELTTELEFNTLVSAVQLPEDDAIPSGQGTLTGWGSIGTTFIPIYPDVLMYVDLPIITYDECAEALIALTGTSEPLLEESNICTGPLDGKSSCTGDSGGPLVTKDGNNTLVGVVSWGMIPCGSKGAPSVYTRVSTFIDWINENIN